MDFSEWFKHAREGHRCAIFRDPTYNAKTGGFQTIEIRFRLPATAKAPEPDSARAANGHPAPYLLKTIEIDNEPWLMMQYPACLDIVNRSCPAIRAKYPNLKLSVAGSYGYDTGAGEGNHTANPNGDPRIIEQAGNLFDILLALLVLPFRNSPSELDSRKFSATHKRVNPKHSA